MALGHALTETEIGTLVQAEIARSIDYDRSEFKKDRVRAIEYDRGEVRDLPVEEGRSSATSRDVSDTIGFMMPGLMRVFFSGDEIVVFEPQGPEDEATAQQASDYINFILRELNAYEVFWDVFQDSLLHANGIVKVWWEPYEKVSVHVYHNLDDNQLSLLLSDNEVEVVEHEPVQIINQDELGNQVRQVLHHVKIKRVQKLGRVKIAAVPPEEFLIDAKANSLVEASFVAHRALNTRSSLIESGFDPEKVAKLPAFGGTMSFDRVQIARREQIGSVYTSSGLDESMDMVETIECYIKCDYNGDGIAETLKVIMGGDGSSEVLDWEEWEADCPFCDFVAERVAHRWLGRSIFNSVEDVMRVKTTLLRQFLDNLYQSNIPDRVVNEDAVANMDSVYDRQIGNVIRVNGDPNSAVSTSVVPFIAKEALTGLQYCDELIEKRTGVSKNTMALDMNALQNQTATAVMAAQAGAYSRIELVARNFAEMGFKEFFKKLLKLIIQNQDKPRTIRLRNQWVEYDPRSWNSNMDCTVSVGLGSGSKERDMTVLQTIAQKQEQIIQMAGPQNPVCGVGEYVNTLKKIVETAGIKNTTQFFKDVDPNQPAQPQQPNPKQAEAQAKLQMQQAESAARMQLEQQEAAAKIQLAREENAARLQIERERNAMELEAMREKHALEMQHKRELAAINEQLKRTEMQNELALTEQSNMLNALYKTGKSPDNNLDRQSVPGE